jgi:hypothetical protein
MLAQDHSPTRRLEPKAEWTGIEDTIRTAGESDPNAPGTRTPINPKYAPFYPLILSLKVQSHTRQNEKIQIRTQFRLTCLRSSAIMRFGNYRSSYTMNGNVKFGVKVNDFVETTVKEIQDKKC